MMERATCESCRFLGGVGQYYDCRRHAPIAFREMGGVLKARWPQVEWHHWCGDHETKQAPAAEATGAKSRVGAAQEKAMDELDELDHDVAAALGGVLDGDGWRFPEPVNGDTFIKTKRSFCRDWTYGGPIIEREGIEVSPDSLTDRKDRVPGVWFATAWPDVEADGPTPLIAAMRAFVASKGKAAV